MSRGRPSRRTLLAAAALLGAPQQLRAQTKASQQQAEYQPEPKGGFARAMCAQFRPPDDCEIVAGVISPNGWCKFFELPD